MGGRNCVRKHHGRVDYSSFPWVEAPLGRGSGAGVVVGIEFPPAIGTAGKGHFRAIGLVVLGIALEHGIEGFRTGKATAGRIVSRLFRGRVQQIGNDSLGHADARCGLACRITEGSTRGATVILAFCTRHAIVIRSCTGKSAMQACIGVINY